MEVKNDFLKKPILFLLLAPVFSFGQLKFLPSSNGEVVEHTYYSLSYVEEHEHSKWIKNDQKTSFYEIRITQDDMRY